MYNVEVSFNFQLTFLQCDYYSFKIFPQFWLAKSTRIIHHDQLLMTKFGRILCLTRKWRQKCSLQQVNAPLTEKTWGRDWVVVHMSVGSGEKAARKFSSKGGRAPGYRLSPNYFQKFKRMLAPDWTRKMLCIIVPNRRTHLHPSPSPWLMH